MTKPGHTGFTRVIKATGYSWQGLRAAWNHESAFRQECVLALMLLPFAFVIASTTLQAVVLISVLGIVLITELLNSALEAVVDRIGHDHHDLAGRAKDMGSAAVFVSLALVIVVWSMMAARNFLMG